MCELIFDAEDHKYYLDGKELISVTQLLKKHGLAHDYSHVDPIVLKKKAARGIVIHSEIEEYINTGAIGFTKEFVDFLRIANELRLQDMRSEVMVNNDIIAGTLDIKSQRYVDGEYLCALIDIKTSSTIDKRACAWQLSLYEYLDGMKYDEFYIFHLRENSRAIKIERIPKEEILRLIECECKGEIYKEQQLSIPQDVLDLLFQKETAIQHFELLKKRAEEDAKNIRNEIFATMWEQGIHNYEDSRFKLTFVRHSARESIDTKRLREELPEVAEKYKKVTNVNGFLKVSLKDFE